MDDILDKNIDKYFYTSDTADKVGGKILSTNAFMAPFVAFIQSRTNESVARWGNTSPRILKTAQVSDSECRCKTCHAKGIPAKQYRYRFRTKLITIGQRQ